jgi:hypothetical protein
MLLELPSNGRCLAMNDDWKEVEMKCWCPNQACRGRCDQRRASFRLAGITTGLEPYNPTVQVCTVAGIQFCSVLTSKCETYEYDLKMILLT